jgi:hypothetical protein
MFERFRFCLNPDCGINFDATNPLANCCTKRCNNRLSYLRKLAKKALGKGASKEALYTYMIIKCLYDRQMRRPSQELLLKMGANFKSFGPPKPYIYGDATSVISIGEFGLFQIDESNHAIVKKSNY